MILFGTLGTAIQINIVMLISLTLFVFHMFFTCKYIYLIASEQHLKAEKYIAYSGYFGVVVMVMQFILASLCFKNDVVDLEYSYLGLIAAAGAIFIIPFLIIYDIKQQFWIKRLSVEDKKKYDVSLKDRLPLVIVVSTLVVISMALFGLCIEAYVYIMQAL